MTGQQLADGLVDEVTVRTREAGRTDAPEVVNEVNAEAPIGALDLVSSAVVYLNLAEGALETCEKGLKN